MLANHDWAAFTGREVFGDEQNSPGKNVRPDINHDVVAGPFRVIEDLARARVGRQARFWKPADDLLPEIILVLLGRDGPVVGEVGLILRQRSSSRMRSESCSWRWVWSTNPCT